MTGTPAPETVTLSAKSRYFCLGAATLRQLTSRHASLQRDLQDAFAGNIRKKLIMAGPYQRQAAAGSSSACGDRMASKRTIEPRGHTAFACDRARFIHEPQSR